jgi:hypothetical protein
MFDTDDNGFPKMDGFPSLGSTDIEQKITKVWKYAWINLFISWIFGLAVIALLAWGGIKLYKGVQTHGLKGVIEHVWEGGGCTHTNVVDISE